MKDWGLSNLSYCSFWLMLENERGGVDSSSRIISIPLMITRRTKKKHVLLTFSIRVK
jgi:hypothetical protein